MRLLHLFDSLAMGGTERVVISRAQAAKRQGLALGIDFHVPGASRQAVSAFEQSVSAFGIEDHLRFVPTLDPAGYDAIFVMDYPAVYHRLEGVGAPVIAEAHQQRRSLQDYLLQLPAFVRLVAAPSASHAAFIRELVPLHTSLRVIPNAVIRPAPARSVGSKPPGSPRLVFCGRMGAVKDTPELVRVFAGVLAAEPAATPVIVTPTGFHAETEAALDATGMRSRVEVNRDVPFHAISRVLDEVRASRGVFVSCSRAESFGLAAAEAIAAGTPVVLSDIPSHRALLASAADGDGTLFPLGDTAGAVSRVLRALRNWDAARTAQAPAALCDERGMLDALMSVVAEARILKGGLSAPAASEA